MTKGDKIFLGGITVILVLAIGIITGGAIDSTGRYRQGQIDALTGKVKYELRVNSDSTRTWEKIKE